ncbi:hypothetical protein [Sanguibacter sp. HDW7]|uniref:hypothetical protein n=1 Tax=Sanguibacter sp. HDW7 TaxID=2714931 RepID=UPI00140C7294|nr:hypothetical protein [Sanguibacter sp. HDW7]QIK84362.1 hypothetical protein G7063_12600 [Sanguibacter sp. HDW7]
MLRRRATFLAIAFAAAASALVGCADPAGSPSGPSSTTPAPSTTTPMTLPHFTTGDRTPLDCPVIAEDEDAAARNTFLVDEDCAARALAAEACSLTVTDPVELTATETAGATRAFGYATAEGARVVLALLPGLAGDNDMEPEYVLACGDRPNAAILTRGDADALLRNPDEGGGASALERVRTLGADPAAELAPGCPGTPASVTAESAGRCVFDAWVEARLYDVGFYAATQVRERFDGDPPTGVVWDGCRAATHGSTAESCYGRFTESGSLVELSIAHDAFSGLRWVTGADFIQPDEG